MSPRFRNRTSSTSRACAALALAAVCGCHTAPSATAPEGTSDPGPSPAIAARVAVRVDGEPISVATYRAYLHAMYGGRLIEDVVTVHLLEREARRLDLMPTPEELEAEVDAGIAELVETRYGGDPEALLAALARDGNDAADYRDYYRMRKHRELLQRRVTLARRVVTEELVLDRFENEYGPGGVKVEVRQVVLAMAREKIALRRANAPEAELADEAVVAALVERAEALLAEIEAGADFGDVARRESHDNQAVHTGGVLEDYRYMRYGPVLADAVRAAPVGVLQGPVVTPTTVHVFEVTERVVTRLEDVRTEVEEAARTAEPELDEILTVEAELRAAAVIERP